MTTLDDIRDAILTWAFSVSGRPVVLDNVTEDAQPIVSYISVFVTQNTIPSFPTSTLNEVGDAITTASNVQITIELNAYGGDTMGALLKLATSLHSNDRNYDLWKIMGLGGAQAPQDLSFLQTGAFKQRGQMKFTVYANISNTFSGGTIDSVAITVNENELNYNRTFTVDKTPPDCPTT